MMCDAVSRWGLSLLPFRVVTIRVFVLLRLIATSPSLHPSSVASLRRATRIARAPLAPPSRRRPPVLVLALLSWHGCLSPRTRCCFSPVALFSGASHRIPVWVLPSTSFFLFVGSEFPFSSCQLSLLPSSRWWLRCCSLLPCWLHLRRRSARCCAFARARFVAYSLRSYLVSWCGVVHA